MRKNLASFNRASQFFQAQATLNEPATVSVINFQAVVKIKGLVSSRYPSAAEFPTAIKDRVCEQSESSSAAAIFQYNRTTVPSRERCLTVLLSREKECQFLKWPIAGKSAESVNWSTMVVKRSSIQSNITPNPDTRRE